MASIRKRKRANGDVWIVDYRDHAGIRRWITCRTRREADEVRAEKVADARQARPRPADPNVTFEEYATAWLAGPTGDLRPSTRRGYDQVLKHHLRPAFGALKVRALHVGHVKALLAEKRTAGYSKNMVRLMRATLSVMLGDAVEGGLLATNPVAQLTRRRRTADGRLSRAERQQKIRPLGPDQLAAVLTAAWEHERRLAPYLLALARAGLRPSEGLALQWDDLDFGARQLRVERSLGSDGRDAPTKTGEARTVDMSAELARALLRVQHERKAETLKRRWAEVPPWVFVSDAGTPLDLSNVTKGWRRVLKKAKLPAFRLYDLRHTFATALLAQGAPITYVAAQMGHAKPTTTLAHYAHWLPRVDSRWVDGLDADAGLVAAAVGSQLVANPGIGGVRRSASGENPWSRRPDLNRGPVDYESTALPTELRRPALILREVRRRH
jgi:integrase